MTKSFLTIAAVSLLALTACEEQATDTTTTNDMMSSVEQMTEETFTEVQAAAEATLQDIEAAYEEAVAEMQAEEAATEIEPAAGTTTTPTTETMTDETTY